MTNIGSHVRGEERGLCLPSCASPNTLSFKFGCDLLFKELCERSVNEDRSGARLFGEVRVVGTELGNKPKHKRVHRFTARIHV